MAVFKAYIPNNGLGDAICCLPVISYLIENKNYDNKYVYTNYSGHCDHRDDIILCSMLYDKVNVVKSNDPSFMKESFRIRVYDETNEWRQYHSVDCAFRSISLHTVDIKYKNYIKYSNILPSSFDFIDKKHVVFNIGYFEEWKKIQDYLLEKIVTMVVKKGYKPVFVGKQSKIKGSGFNNIYRTSGIDLVDKTSINDLLRILSKARLLISADSGVIHLGGMTDIPIFGVYTGTDPLLKLPIRNNKIGYMCDYVIPNPPCFCITSVDWRGFPCYNTDRYSCVNRINHEEALNKIEEILKWKN